VIAPAVVTLLGDHAWWLPRWLDRILPKMHLEGIEPAEEPDEEPALVG
jgi:putative drug exporter of the RND superfamily